MEITLLPGTAQRLRAALGEEVDLSPAAVPAALSRLAVEAPAVYSQVLTELSGSHIRLDSERALQRRHRRSLLRRAFFWWGEYESEAGDRLLAKRRLAAAVPFGLAGAMLILLVVSGAVTHRSPPALVRAGVTDMRPTPLARPRSGEAPRRVPAARVLRPVAAQAVARPLPVLLIPGPLTAQQPPLQAASALLTPSLSNRAQPTPPGNPVVFDRQQARVFSAPAGVQGEASVTPAPVIYDRGAANASGAGENSATSSQAGSQWIPGQRVAARLATGVVVVAGGPPMPVIAESVDPGSTWLGRATLGPEGRVQVTFTLASPGGGVHGVALDPDHLVPGLMGRMTLRHPHAAAAVMTSALQAAGDYVQALARQGEVTLADGWAQLAVGQTAPAWTYAAARLAQVLEPRGGAAGPVETAEIAAGSHLTILVMEAP